MMLRDVVRLRLQIESEVMGPLEDMFHEPSVPSTVLPLPSTTTARSSCSYLTSVAGDDHENGASPTYLLCYCFTYWSQALVS
jgi:hypothetical protein